MIVFQTGGPGTSTVKYCGSHPPFTGKRDCWKELRIPILTSNTNMSLCYTIVFTNYTIVFIK